MAVGAGLHVSFLILLSRSPPGVPKQHRGEVWKFLSEQHSLRQTLPSPPAARKSPYKELLQQVSSEQHAILIDLGNADTHRTHAFTNPTLKMFITPPSHKHAAATPHPCIYPHTHIPPPDWLLNMNVEIILGTVQKSL